VRAFAAIWLVTFGCGGNDTAGHDGATPDTPAGSDATTSAYRDAVLADDPIGYWRLGGATGTAHDETVAGEDGAYVGSCAVAPGAIANDPDAATKLDGTSCNVTLPDAFDFPGNVPFTIELWVSAPPPGTSFRHLFAKETRNAQNPIDGYSMVISPNVGIELERVVASAIVKTPAQALPANTFVHAVTTFDGAKMSLYVDGVLVGSTADATPATSISTPALIGATSTGGFFDGTLDEVVVYAKALDPARIAAHHTIGAP